MCHLGEHRFAGEKWRTQLARPVDHPRMVVVGLEQQSDLSLTERFHVPSTERKIAGPRLAAHEVFDHIVPMSLLSIGPGRQVRLQYLPDHR